MGHLKSNPTDQKLYFFAHSKRQYRSLLFYQNSPVLPMFNQGAQYLREKGIIHQLHMKWIGSDNTQGESEAEIMVLTGGQTVLLFVLLIGILAISMVTFCGELVVKAILNMKDNDNKHRRRAQRFTRSQATGVGW